MGSPGPDSSPWLGAVAGSLALVGFGTVSVVEEFASGVVLWHLSPRLELTDPGRTPRALRRVADLALTAVVMFAPRRLGSRRAMSTVGLTGQNANHCGVSGSRSAG